VTRERAVDSEARLVRKAQAGDRQAFAAVVETHRHRIYTLAVRELGSAADAEDAVQEALIRAWRALPRFRADASFGTWLYRICLNAVHDQRARSARGSGLPLEDVGEPADPRDAIGEAELSGELQRALAGLDETYRTAVLLYDVLGHSYAEIAAVLGVAEGTVKSRIFRGRTELARRLGTARAGGESEER
jgi:RNA polymerase sigma-70 factor (ECF subfamily)